jgi:DNA ligase-1
LDYAILADAYQRMDDTSKRSELTQILSGLFRATPLEVLPKLVYLTQGKLYPDFQGIEMGIADKSALKVVREVSLLSAKEIAEEYRRSGDIGSVAYAALQQKGQNPLFSNKLTVDGVYHTLDGIAKDSGSGAGGLKLKKMTSLLGDATPKEAKYLMRTVTGKLRLGIADYTVLDGLAVAYLGAKSLRKNLEVAYNLSSDLGLVAKVVAENGLAGIGKFRAKIGNPIRPMLAERLSSATEAIDKLGGEVAAEHKLDGERLQIHIEPQNVTIFSRRLENITNHFPDVEKVCRSRVRSRKAILEGEAVAIDRKTGSLLPFQELMHRRRKYGVGEAVEQYPTHVFLFDLLYLEGKNLMALPYKQRRRMLSAEVKEDQQLQLVQQMVTSDPEEIDDFLDKAISAGSEGLVIKDLAGSYRAGARGFLWIKLKKEYRSELSDTLDLVVVGAIHGMGRRRGVYGAFLLAAYDPETDTFTSICKVGTGFTDAYLKSLHGRLQGTRVDRKHPRVEARMQMDVWFEPQVVLEVISSEITLSPIHTSNLNDIRHGMGFALRFPKFTGKQRDNKRAEDATTTSEIADLYHSQLKRMAS